MSQLRIILADLPSELGNSAIKYPAPIRSTLQELFSRIVASQSKNTKFPLKSVHVQWWSTAFRGGSRKNPGPSSLTLSDQDLLVYFVRDSGDSVVRHMSKQSPGHGTGWTSFLGKITASEVYTNGNQDDPVGLAKLAFHEFMHNASHFSDAKLHTLKTHNGLPKAKGGKPMSLSAGTVSAATPLSEGDVQFMVDHLPKHNRRPWTDGYRAYADPLNGHL